MHLTRSEHEKYQCDDEVGWHHKGWNGYRRSYILPATVQKINLPCKQPPFIPKDVQSIIILKNIKFSPNTYWSNKFGPLSRYWLRWPYELCNKKYGLRNDVFLNRQTLAADSPAWQDAIASAAMSLQWRHNGHDGVINHQPHDCLLNRLFKYRSKKTSKLCVTGLCAGNSPVIGEFPAQRASNAENVSIWWRHHVLTYFSRNIAGSVQDGVCMQVWFCIRVATPCNIYSVNTLRPRQIGRQIPDDIFKRIFLNESVWISMKISLKFVPRHPIDNIPALV